MGQAAPPASVTYLEQVSPLYPYPYPYPYLPLFSHLKKDFTHPPYDDGSGGGKRRELVTVMAGEATIVGRRR